MQVPYDKTFEQLWIIAVELESARALGKVPPFPLTVAAATDDVGRRKAAVVERLEAMSAEDAAALNGPVFEYKFECLVFDIGLGDADFLGVGKEPGRFGLGTKGLALRTEIEGVKALLERKNAFRPGVVATQQFAVADDRIRARFGLYQSGAKRLSPENAAWLAERAKSAPPGWWWYHLEPKK